MNRKLLFVLIALMAALVLPLGIVLADSIKPFSASGAITQTNSGTTAAPIAFSATQQSLSPLTYAGFAAQLPYGASTPGQMTTGQGFTGSLTASDWGALKSAAGTITHNSWFTADTSALAQPGDTTALVGVAWGTFQLSKGKGNAVAAGYEAIINGSLTLDPTCPNMLSVSVNDVGGWQVAPGSATGSFKQVNGGSLVVNASGCLFSEQATLSLTGVRGGDDDDKGDKHDKDDGPNHGNKDSGHHDD